jgi:hypothetical protein
MDWARGTFHTKYEQTEVEKYIATESGGFLTGIKPCHSWKFVSDVEVIEQA